jgi:DNA-binding transcriptional MerR regulator
MKLNSTTAAQFHCPRYGELPSLGLYMDQAVYIIEESLRLFAEESERVITPTMINNYVKQKLIEPPVKKKYGKDHIAALIVVTMLKKVLPISEIGALIANMCREAPLCDFYDLFCERLERLLREVFSADGAPVIYTRDCLDSALAALVGKLMVLQFLSHGTNKEEST